MTRKDYETIAGAVALARVFASTSRLSAEEALDVLAVNLAERLATDSDRFNRARFYDACDPLRTSSALREPFPTSTILEQGNARAASSVTA